MPVVSGTLAFSRLYRINEIQAEDFGGTNPNNTLALEGLSQVDPSAVDTNAQINDVNGNGELNGVDTVTTTFPGDGSPTTLSRVDLSAQFGGIAGGFGSGTHYAIFEDPSGQQYILFSRNVDTSLVSGGEITLTEQGDAPGNMANSEIICFASGTQIAAPHGPRLIEDIEVGDTLCTLTGGLTRVEWRSRSQHSAGDLAANPKLAPVCIKAGAFGHGLPDRDLLLSRQHRVLLRSRVARRMFGSFDVFVPCHTLLPCQGVFMSEAEAIDYHHVLTDKHSVLLANSLPCESLLMAEHLARVCCQKERTVLEALLTAQKVDATPAHRILSNTESRGLLERLLKAGRPFIEFETSQMT